MKLFGKSKSSDQSKNMRTVLFVCVENAGRSQMAEGFFRKYSPKNYRPLSAGTRPVADVNPLVIQVMSEGGIDMSKQRPKIITEDMIRQASTIVNMGRIERNACRSLFIHNLIDWNIEDPKGKPIDKVLNELSFAFEA